MENNNFKHLEPEQEAPHEIRNEIESSLGFFRYAGRVLDLYIGKIAWLFTGLVRGYHLDEDTPDSGALQQKGFTGPDHHSDGEDENDRENGV